MMKYNISKFNDHTAILNVNTCGYKMELAIGTLLGFMQIRQWCEIAAQQSIILLLNRPKSIKFGNFAFTLYSYLRKPL